MHFLPFWIRCHSNLIVVVIMIICCLWYNKLSADEVMKEYLLQKVFSCLFLNLPNFYSAFESGKNVGLEKKSSLVVVDMV